MEAIKARHSVRQYKDQPIDMHTVETLRKEITACNRESGMHIQLIVNEPKAFDGFMAHYGKFSGVKNYIAMIGKKGPDLEEICGYYGERLVLLAQQLGLNTCWVAMTYSKVKTAYQIGAGEKLCFILNGSEVTATTKGGFYTKMDLGIVRYHFEAASGKSLK